MYIVLVPCVNGFFIIFSRDGSGCDVLSFLPINAVMSFIVCSGGILILLYFIIFYSDKERLAFIPAVYPLFHAQSRLYPPHLPWILSISPHRYKPLALRDSSLSETSLAGIPPQVICARLQSDTFLTG